jgi:glycerol-3-phosphate dehydrogenase
MAADAIDAAMRSRGASHRRSTTAKLALRGSVGLTYLRQPGVAARLGVTDAVLDHLIGRYGGEGPRVLAAARDDPDLLRHLVPGLPYLRVEAVWAVRKEMARTLEDVLSRRTRALLLDRDATELAAADTAALIGPILGWDAAETDRQLAAFARLAARERAAIGV